MPITRIKNNQITNATIDAGTKLVDASITAGKLGPNLNYASNLTITGNLSVDGTSTTLDTVNTLIEDPILLLGKDQTGVAAYDLGFVGERGDSDNAVFVWKESADEFQFGTTTGTGDGTTVTLAGFADIQAAGITGTTLALSGNITGPLNVTGSIEASTTITAVGNVAGGNITTAGAMEATGLISSGTTITATGNVVGGNVTTGGAVEATGLISSGSTITATGNVAGGNITTAAAMDSATINTTGEATLASAIVSDLTSGRVVLAGTAGAIEDSANMTFNGSTLGVTGAITASTTITATGNVAGGNVTTAGQVQADNIDSTNAIVGGTTITATGNVAGGNITTGGAVEATGLITSGTTITATGNVAGGNLTTGGDIDATGDIAGGSVTTNVFRGSLPVISSTGTNADISINPNGTGSINVNSAKITSLATPTADGDAANKAYVDSIAEGLDIKASCHAATTTVLPAVTYANGTDGVGATLTADANGAFAAVDGVTFTINERLLVKDQAAQLQNGIYQLSTVGDAGTPFVLTRTTDFDNGTPSGEIPGAFTFIEEGTVNEDNGFVCTTNSPVTVGTTAIVWVQFSGAGAISAGAGLSKTGDTLNVEVDDVTTAIVSDEVTVKVSANLTTPNIGVANGDSFTASGIVTATGNVTGGNLTTGGDVTTVTVTASGAIAGSTTITATGNVVGGNLTTAAAMDSATINTTGEATLASAIVSDLTSGRVVLAGTAGAIEDNGNFTFDGSTAAVTGAITASTTITATGNVAGGNVTTGGAVEATGLISSGSTITATGNVAGGNITTGGAMEATGLISSGTTITATGNVAGGNVTTGGRVDATGEVKGASLATGNITIGTDDIDSTGEKITVNQSSNDVDFIVEGNGDATLLVLDAGADTVNIGTATVTAGAKLKVAGTDSILIPVGTSAQRPGTPATGMIRLNTTLDSFEFYDSNSWTTAGADFTVIASETFNGDNSTVAFTLATSQTTASCIVSINGVVQLPTTAYAVSTTTLTFTEAPLSGDVIEVREITTTSTITYISNAQSTASIEALDGVATVEIVGDLTPKVTGTQDLGSATKVWTQANIDTAIFYDGDRSNTVSLSAPATVGSNIAFVLPATDGTAGQAMVTDASGNLSFAAAGATVSQDNTTNTNFNLYFAATTSGALTAVKYDGADLLFNPSTSTLSCTNFSGVAGSAKYADLAEMYASDGDIEAGTVVHFSGEGKVAECDIANCRSVAGIVSTDPAYLMNSDADGVALAIAGRVPTKVTGVVNAGDLIVSAGNGRGMANNDAAIGTVIGKAIESNEGGDGVIEVLALMM